jgi:putative spermidine/putrescine transport system substrate-binding protein
MKSRRRIAWSLFALVIMLAISCSVNKDSNTGNVDTKPKLVIASYGGAYQDSQRKAYFDAFAKQFNVTIVEETHSGELAKIRAMVESGNVNWDVVDVETHMVFRGADLNLYEPIDYNVVDKTKLLPEAIHPNGVGTMYWSTVIAYNTQVFPPDKPRPTTWAEFWDIKKFPGPRCLRKNPVSTLEFALLADGVKPENLYPLDVDRAFRSLDKIKDSVKVWWETGSQPPQLLANKDVVLSSVFSGRIAAAAKEGQPLAFEWNQGMLDLDWWVIPRGTKNKDLAMKFIAFASSAQQQALQTNYIPYGPVNTEAFSLIPTAVRPELPTNPENKSKQFVVNAKWWAEHEKEIQERWEAWLLK